MSDITFDTARLLAERLLDAEIRPSIDEDVIINDAETIETDNVWVFFLQHEGILGSGSCHLCSCRKHADPHPEDHGSDLLRYPGVIRERQLKDNATEMPQKPPPEPVATLSCG